MTIDWDVKNRIAPKTSMYSIFAGLLFENFRFQILPVPGSIDPRSGKRKPSPIAPGVVFDLYATYKDRITTVDTLHTDTLQLVLFTCEKEKACGAVGKSSYESEFAEHWEYTQPPRYHWGELRKVLLGTADWSF